MRAAVPVVPSPRPFLVSFGLAPHPLRARSPQQSRVSASCYFVILEFIVPSFLMSFLSRVSINYAYISWRDPFAVAHKVGELGDRNKAWQKETLKVDPELLDASGQQLFAWDFEAIHWHECKRKNALNYLTPSVPTLTTSQSPKRVPILFVYLVTGLGFWLELSCC